MKKTIVLMIAGILICTSLLSGCSARGNEKGEQGITTEKKGEAMTVTLNDRQKEILQIEDLPQNYEELNSSQKNAITKIEMCFEYIEKKYPEDTFEYVQFLGYDLMSNSLEALVVSSQKLKDMGNVTISVKQDDDSYVFSDNYEVLNALRDYESEIESFVKTKKPDAKLFVVAESDEMIPDGDDINAENGWIGAADVVMTNVFSGEGEVDSLLEELANWSLEKYGVSARSFGVVVLDESSFKEATRDNYINDYVRKHKAPYIYHCDCYVDASGNVRVAGRK